MSNPARRHKRFRKATCGSRVRWRIPGAVCSVAGHLGRYLGHGIGAYLVLDGSGKPRDERTVRVYRAEPPQAADLSTAAGMLASDLLPSETQLHDACIEHGIPLP